MLRFRSPRPSQRPALLARYFDRVASLLRRARPTVRQWLFAALVLLTLLTGPNGLLTNMSVSYAQAQIAGTAEQPNRFDPRQDTTSQTHPTATGHADPHWQAGPPQPLTHPLLPLMAPGALRLPAGQAATFVGSDGHLEVDVPAGAVTAADLAQAGGGLTLLVSQIAPASGSSAGGSGHLSLGSYLLQLVDAQGRRVNHGLHAALTLLWHASAAEALGDLIQPVVVFNSTLPAGTTLAPAAVASTPTLGARTTQPATVDATRQTLAVTTTLATSSASLSWNTDSPVAVFGTPDPFTVGLSSGSLSFSEPLALPAGPNGQVPPVTLSYSSASVSGQHNGQGAAGWVGEGWSLSGGAISWAEHNVTAANGYATWQNSWQLSDPYGTGVELIPPNLTTSISLDDTGNSLSSPVSWQTAPDAHVKVISYTGPNSVWAAPATPLFPRLLAQRGDGRVWLYA
jgi:hypothetical protein